MPADYVVIPQSDTRYYSSQLSPDSHALRG
jgi:hypothetical protein